MHTHMPSNTFTKMKKLAMSWQTEMSNKAGWRAQPGVSRKASFLSLHIYVDWHFGISVVMWPYQWKNILISIIFYF